MFNNYGDFLGIEGIYQTQVVQEILLQHDVSNE